MSIGIVIVNWNGWPDTLECLEAILRMDGFVGRIVVIDNGSSDGSVQKIVEWMHGDMCVVPQSAHPIIKELIVPPVEKPIEGKLVRAHEIEAMFEADPCRLFLIPAGENMGFAAANNLGLRLLKLFSDVDIFWLLNNDALPSQDAHLAILRAANENTNPLIGGSVLAEYWEPSKVQAVGGRFHRWFGLGPHAAEGTNVSKLLHMPDNIPVDYPIGASLFVNRRFLEQYGVLSESYFLYYEEIDWVLRAGWPSKAVALSRSVVFHKGSQSISAAHQLTTRSLTADYCMLRGRLLLAKKQSAPAIIIALLANLVAILKRLLIPRKHLATNAIRATFDGLFGREGRAGVRWQAELRPPSSQPARRKLSHTK